MSTLIMKKKIKKKSRLGIKKNNLETQEYTIFDSARK